MIAALVLFENGDDITLEDATERFNGTAPGYRGRAGLHSKAYIYAEDGKSLGGFYVFDSRDEADALYTDAWREKVTAVYGVAPTVKYFDVPVLIENG